MAMKESLARISMTMITAIFKGENIMKQTVAFFGIAAIAAMSLVSCQKETSMKNTGGRMIDMIVQAGPDAMTRTVLQDDGTVLWGTGETLLVLETAGSTTTAAISSEGVTSDEGQTMTFGVSFTENTEETSFTYNAVYPASAWSSVGDDENTNVTALKTIFPATQKPTATSFDASADLLIAKPLPTSEQPTTLSLSFQRMVAVGKMTIKNLASEFNVKEVVFTAISGEEGANQPILAGRNRYNLTEGTAEYGYNSPVNAITMDYSGQSIAANGMTAYFTSCPFELGEGDSFKVAVTTEDGKIYTKVITISSGKSLAFKAGRASKFSVNMEGAEEETTQNLEGKYIIVGKTGTDWRYMKNEVSSGTTPYLIAAETKVTKSADKIDLTSSATDFPAVSEYWEVVKSGDNYAIKSASGTYINWTSGNSATLAENAYGLKITKQDNGSYMITSVAESTRSLRFNSSSPRFAFYTSAQTDVYMIPYVVNTTPYIEASQTTFEVPAAGAEYAIALNCQNLTGDVTAVASEDWIDISYAGDDEVDFEVATNSGEARSATITISSEGAADVVVTVSQFAASGNDGSTPETAYTASEAYAFVSNMTSGVTSTDKYYVKGIISSIKYSFSAEYGTATFNFSDDGTTTGSQFIAYSTYYLEDKSWVEGNTQIQVGDEVIVYGQVVNYEGNTPEFASKKSYLYSLNGKTSEQGVDPGDLTKGDPWTSGDFTDKSQMTTSWYTVDGVQMKSSIAASSCETANYARGLAWASGNSPVITLSGYPDGIETVTVVMSTNGASTKVKVGSSSTTLAEQDVTSGTGAANTEYTFTFDELQSGNITITVTNTASKSVWIKSISIN